MRLRVVVAIAVGIALATPARASEPGQPLDCEDWIFFDPGLTCVPYRENDIYCDTDSPECEYDRRHVLDNRGRSIWVVQHSRDWCGGIAFWRTDIVVYESGDTRTIASLQDRCVDNAVVDQAWPALDAGGALAFDAASGKLHVKMQRDCRGSGECPYSYRPIVFLIEGFASLFEILQTYTPNSGPLSFRVPYMPEGFQHADYFDTYWGDLATVGDWSQAQSLRCGYPATAPSVGDYLTVCSPSLSPEF